MSIRYYLLLFILLRVNVKELFKEISYERDVEQIYHKILSDKLDVIVEKRYYTDGIIHIKGTPFVGVLETKYDRYKYDNTKLLTRAFVQACWYTFKIPFDVKFIIIGSNKTFKCFYLDDYPELINSMRDYYSLYKDRVPSNSLGVSCPIMKYPEFMKALTIDENTNLETELENLQNKLKEITN